MVFTKITQDTNIHGSMVLTSQGPSSQVERWPNLPIGIMRKWFLSTCLRRNHLATKVFCIPQNCKCTYPLVPPNLPPPLQCCGGQWDHLCFLGHNLRCYHQNPLNFFAQLVLSRVFVHYIDLILSSQWWFFLYSLDTKK